MSNARQSRQYEPGSDLRAFVGFCPGLLYAARFPTKVAAYVGSGQIGDWPNGEASSYAFALAEAEGRNNRKALKELLALGPPPYNPAAVSTERMWLQRFDGQVSPKALWSLARVLFRGPESSIVDLPNLVGGFGFSLSSMWPEVSRLKLLRAVPELQMPVFFFLGRRDHFVPAEVSVAYSEVLTAPSKKLIWLEESGHEPFVDEPQKFNKAMVELVRSAISP